ncbi:MAG TPA: ABC transporter permease subunit [Desulfobulbaceae bacterium]|nr:ABC transporter permease subunit [Desulfobulbaceae bacterium]
MSAGFHVSKDVLARIVIAASAWVSAAVVLFLFLFLAWFCRPLLDMTTLARLLSWDWRPFQGSFGILSMLTGSLLLAFSSMLLAFPVGVGICCFIHGIGPPSLARFVLRAVKLMTSVPTVVYGFVAVFVLVPLLRDVFHRGSGFSLLAAILGLAILVLPTVVLMLHSRFLTVEPQVRLTAAALGMTSSQKLLHLVIPASKRGFLAAAVLGLGRALGDTMIPLMLAGNAPQVPGSVFDSVRAMTAHIALVVATDSHSLAYLSLFACGLLLFLTTTLVNIGLRMLTRNREVGS